MTRPDLLRFCRRYGPWLVAAALLVVHSLQFGFVTDDAYISFVYSRNLAHHGQLGFNLGLPPVEGYTNFLWTVLLAGLMKLGLPPEVTSLVLGTGFALATMVVVLKLGEALAGPSDWDHLAPALLALSSGYACWASGGLETQMFTFWIALALYLYICAASAPRRLRHLGWVLGLAAMTRPEGLFVAAIVVAHRLGWNLVFERRLRPSRDELVAAAGFLALWAPWFAWRWWYYGYPFPNTYYVKAAGPASKGYDQEMHRHGLYYVGQWLRQTRLIYGFPLVLAGFAVAWPRSARFRLGSLALVISAVYLAYTISVGGDFMGLHRFVMPLFPLAALGLALGLRAAVGLIGNARARTLTAAAAATLLLAGFGWTQLELTRRSLAPGNLRNDHGIDSPAFLRVYAHDRALIGRLMRPCFRPGDFAIYGGAGAKPYYAELPGIDVFGLVSDRIAHEVPRSNPRAGHNKWAPDPLLASYDPTFVFSCYSIHDKPANANWAANTGSDCRPYWKAHGFEEVTLHVPGLAEKGEYYSFLVRADRHFDCPGKVP